MESFGKTAHDRVKYLRPCFNDYIDVIATTMPHTLDEKTCPTWKHLTVDRWCKQHTEPCSTFYADRK